MFSGALHAIQGRTMRVVGCGLAAVALLMAGCGGSASDGGPGAQSSPSSSRQAAVKIVALGDSDTTGIGDATGRGWVGRYGVRHLHRNRSETEQLATKLLAILAGLPTTGYEPDIERRAAALTKLAELDQINPT